MKQRIAILSLGMVAAAQAMAQETYLNAAMSTEALNGTARYVGMGGAMDALGADLSTISSNPAGIGLFRSSQAKVSFGLVSQDDVKSFANGNKTTMSFDQAGFVYSMRTGPQSFLNVALNYHKSSNFDQILSAASTLSDASQNKLSYLKGLNGLFALATSNDVTSGYDGGSLRQSNMFNNVDYLYYNTVLPSKTGQFGFSNANGYIFDRATTGYIGCYELNLSGNHNDQLYWGLTVGISDVHYNAYTRYSEQLVDNKNLPTGTVTMTDDRRITGTGVSIKAGLIVRPVADSPFRFGLSVASPTFYDLTSSYSASTENNMTGYAKNNYGKRTESYDFRLNTPWKFGLSAGTTIGRSVALGASYEYADYGSLDTRIKNGGYYDIDGYYYTSSTSDNAMNTATKQTLKGVSTLKLGAEFRPDPAIAVRLGYNYVSPMYKDNAYKGICVNSIGGSYASTTDYTNWKSTNRITCGLGFTVDKFTIDLAYQFSMQDGTFHPFTNYESGSYTNYANGVKVNNNQHQLLMTLGYAF